MAGLKVTRFKDFTLAAKKRADETMEQHKPPQQLIPVKRPVPLAEQPRMQTTNPERLLLRLLTHGAKLWLQLTRQSLFRPWQE